MWAFTAARIIKTAKLAHDQNMPKIFEGRPVLQAFAPSHIVLMATPMYNL